MDIDLPVDEEKIQSFERLWIEGSVPVLDDFVPDASDSTYRGTLLELVAIDLEFRWKLRPKLLAAESSNEGGLETMSQAPFGS